MDFERTLETQRLKLLRIVAGLVVVVGVLAIGPVSRRFSDWTLGFVESILSRAEAAAQYLIIAQAGLMASRSGSDIDQSRISERLARVSVVDETNVALSECRRRLKGLRAVLFDISGHAARLLRRIEKQMRRALCGVQRSSWPEQTVGSALLDWHLPTIRIERPPDKPDFASLFFLPPSETRREALAVKLVS